MTKDKKIEKRRVVFCCWCGIVHEDSGCPKLKKDKNFRKFVKKTLAYLNRQERGE